MSSISILLITRQCYTWKLCMTFPYLRFKPAICDYSMFNPLANIFLVDYVNIYNKQSVSQRLINIELWGHMHLCAFTFLAKSNYLDNLMYLF